MTDGKRNVRAHRNYEITVYIPRLQFSFSRMEIYFHQCCSLVSILFVWFDLSILISKNENIYYLLIGIFIFRILFSKTRREIKKIYILYLLHVCEEIKKKTNASRRCFDIRGLTYQKLRTRFFLTISFDAMKKSKASNNYASTIFLYKQTENKLTFKHRLIFGQIYFLEKKILTHQKYYSTKSFSH